MVIVEDFKSLSYSEELFSTWTYRYATEILNTDKIPLKELTEQVDFVNSYKGAVVIKVLKTENIDEEKKFIEKKLSRDKHFKDFTQKEMNYLYMLTDNIIYLFFCFLFFFFTLQGLLCFHTNLNSLKTRAILIHLLPKHY